MIPLPSLRQLQHLVALSEQVHFGRAAEACFITQSSLSASIKELENVLGAVLVERTKRSVQFTALGLQVADRARTILSETGDLVDLVQAAAAPLSGGLRLGVIPTISPFLLPRLLPTLRQAYPDLRLYLREEQTTRLLEQLAAGDLDVLLLAFPYPMAKTATEVFAEDPFLVAFSRTHPFAGRERITTADLAGENLLLLEDGHCLRDHALAACGLATLQGEKGFQGTSLHTLVQMVDNGLGLTLLPKMAVDGGIIRGTKIAVRPLDGPAPGRQIGLAWRKTSPRAAELKLLGNVFRDELAMPVRPGRRLE